MRKPWKEYWADIATLVATRSTCDRMHVGCVIVRDNIILSTGYNGSLRGAKHCDDAGHEMVDGHCVRTVHAEVNAICQAARLGIKLDGATAYVTHEPCHRCAKALWQAGVRVSRMFPSK